MKSNFYRKLAWIGICKNKQLYLPYILTCTGMVMMYYTITFLSNMDLLGLMSGGNILQAMLYLGTFVIAVFALIFLFYTNSFLIRRRKKEFGLYNILGMNKVNISRLLLWEYLMIAVISLGVGLLSGVVFSKLAELGLIGIMKEDASYSISVSIDAIMATIVLFCIIYALIFLNGLRHVYANSPIELLHSENLGEKPPKANWILGIAGALILMGAYYMAVSIQNPIEALLFFFVAVIMVIIATYLLFIVSSVLMCKLLQKRKGYYYKTKHFVSLSSMAYRMKRNGAGLASICILGTMVLVMITGSACLYFGSEDSLQTGYPRDILLGYTDDNMEAPQYDSARNIETMRSEIEQILSDNGLSAKYNADYRITQGITSVCQAGIADVENNAATAAYGGDTDMGRQLYFMPLFDYNRVTGEQKELASNEVMIATVRCDYTDKTFEIRNGTKFQVVDTFDNRDEQGNPTIVTEMSERDILPAIIVILPEYEKNMAVISEDIRNENSYGLERAHWYYGLDLDADKDTEMAVYSQMQDMMSNISSDNSEESSMYYSLQSREANRGDFYGTYGGLFFIGIMLSIIFIFATVLIIYYKQISEGYEDQSRFEIMQKVGMTDGDIRKSINSQMLTVFFLPLATAVVHLAFAFPMLQKMLLLFALQNTALLLATAAISVLIFAVCYTVVYKITSRAYYNIVKGGRPA